MTITELAPKKIPTFEKLRRIARERTRKILSDTPEEVNMPLEDIRFLAKFISDSAFYIEELENHIGEDLMDFWQEREHALRIVTAQMIGIGEKDEE